MDLEALYQRYNFMDREEFIPQLRIPTNVKILSGGSPSSVYVFFMGNKNISFDLFYQIYDRYFGTLPEKFTKDDHTEVGGVYPEKGDCWWMIETYCLQGEVPKLQTFLDNLEKEFGENSRKLIGKTLKG